MDETGTDAGACERCGDQHIDGRYCARCGLDRTPDEPALPTQEARLAAARDTGWRSDNPSEEGTDSAGWAPPQEARPVVSWDVPIPEYKSSRIRSLVATRWLALSGILALVILALDLYEAALLEASRLDATRVDSIDRINGLLSLSSIAVLIVSAVLFLTWFWRAYSNLPALGIAAPRYGRGWAIGGWFVPILWLWRPKQLANDIWRSGDTTADTDTPFWRERPLSALLTWWWALWIVTGLFDRVLWGLEYDITDPAGYASDLRIDAAAQAIWIISTVLAILVIRRSTTRQDRRADQLRRAAEAASQPAAQPVLA